jgi:ubiquitin carboxyl-terminal hydrolase 8
MNISKYYGKGYTGLANLGNTCFLNSCLQVLSHIYELNELFDSEKINKLIKDIPDAELLIEWNNLRHLMWSKNGIISPNKFVFGVQHLAHIKNKEMFTGWGQNDMTEFLFFIIDCMHNAISRKIRMRINGKPENKTDKIAVQCYNMLNDIYSNEYSEIMDLFYGIYVTSIISMDEKKVHVSKPEHYFILDLEIGSINSSNNLSIYDCFDLFTKKEELVGDNSWMNEKKGKKEDVKRNAHFWNFPKILVIALKRFSSDGTRKLNDLVDFPLENLNLSKYVIGYNKETYLYDLFGVCNHMGGVTGGHYTTFVKNADEIWCHYNDTLIERVEQLQDIVSPMAYCLFYRKKITS